MGDQTIIPPAGADGAWNDLSFSYAGFMDRLIAITIDQIILYLGKFLVLFPLLVATFLGGFLAVPTLAATGAETAGVTPSVWILSLVIDWVYFAVMESSESGATLGKRAMKIKVVGENGERLTFRRASVRYFSKILSYIPLMLGFVMALFTRRKQALHDLIAETIVINRP